MKITGKQGIIRHLGVDPSSEEIEALRSSAGIVQNSIRFPGWTDV